MGFGGVVRVGVVDAPVGSCKLRSRSNGGEDGGELCERPRQRHACVAYRRDDELHMSPVSLKGRDEGGVLRGLGFELGVAAEVPATSDFDDDAGAKALVECGRVRGGGVGYPSGVYKVRRRRALGFLRVIVSTRGYGGVRPCTPRRPLRWRGSRGYVYLSSCETSVCRLCLL